MARVARTDCQRATADLRAAGPPALLVERDDIAQRVAELLADVWRAFVEPEWRERRAVLERDVATRSNLLASRGWAHALDRLNPAVQWLGVGRLQVNRCDYPVQDSRGAQLLLTPCSFGSSWLCLNPPDAYVIAYPAFGLGNPTDPETDGGPDRLIGRTCARLLRALTHTSDHHRPCRTTATRYRHGRRPPTCATRRWRGRPGPYRAPRALPAHRTR